MTKRHKNPENNHKQTQTNHKFTQKEITQVTQKRKQDNKNNEYKY